MSASSSPRPFFCYKIIPTNQDIAPLPDRERKKPYPSQFIDEENEETPEWDLPDPSQGQLMDISVGSGHAIHRRRTWTSSTPLRPPNNTSKPSELATKSLPKPLRSTNPPNPASSPAKKARFLEDESPARRRPLRIRVLRLFRRATRCSQTIWSPICDAPRFLAVSCSCSPPF